MQLVCSLAAFGKALPCSDGGWQHTSSLAAPRQTSHVSFFAAKWVARLTSWAGRVRARLHLRRNRADVLRRRRALLEGYAPRRLPIRAQAVVDTLQIERVQSGTDIVYKPMPLCAAGLRTVYE